MHNDFTLFTRKVPSGKTVVYYYAYNDEGKRLGPWTTGQPNKTAARNFCNKLNRQGKLLPGPKDIPTLEEYSIGFWDWENSPYLKERKKRSKLTQGYADKNKRVLESALLPHFGKMRIDKITADDVEKWFDKMIAEKYKHTTINSYYGTLKTMLVWAAKKRVIPGDPFAALERLMNDRKPLSIVTESEFKDLFVMDWRRVWDNDVLRCTANKLAALTGMRMCEVLGLRGEFVYAKNLFLNGQFDEYGYRETKTKIKHHIPLTSELVKDLRKLIKVNGQGFIFSLDGGEKPVTPKHIGNGLRKAFRKIGLTKEEISERGLNFHGWRHFCNTELQKGGLTVKKVQAVTGHKSERMTEWYTHFDPSEFGEVPKIQAKLLKPKPEKTESKAAEKPKFTLIKQPEQKQAIA